MGRKSSRSRVSKRTKKAKMMRKLYLQKKQEWASENPHEDTAILSSQSDNLCINLNRLKNANNSNSVESIAFRPIVPINTGPVLEDTLGISNQPPDVRFQLMTDTLKIPSSQNSTQGSIKTEIDTSFEYMSTGDFSTSMELSDAQPPNDDMEQIELKWSSVMADFQVKPCSVVLRVGEVENYLKQREKVTPLFEIQKVAKTEPCDDEVLPPEFVNVDQESPPEAKRTCLDHFDFGTVKQEPQDKVTLSTVSNQPPINQINTLVQTQMPSLQPEWNQTVPSSAVPFVQNSFSSSNSTTIAYCVLGDDTLSTPGTFYAIIPNTNSIGPNTNSILNAKVSKKLNSEPTYTTTRYHPVPPAIWDLNFELQFQLPFENNVTKIFYIPMNLKGIKNHSEKQALYIIRSRNFNKRIKYTAKFFLYCIFCSKNFKNNHLAYLKHIEYIHNLKIICILCGENCTDLSFHILSKHNFTFNQNTLVCHYIEQIYDFFWTRLFVCLYCNLPLHNYISLVRHVKSVHHNCRTCCETFNNENQLLAHIDRHSSGEIRYFKCNSCDLKLYSFQLLSDHIQTCLGSLSQEIVIFPIECVQLQLKCPYCPLSFIKETNLIQHLLEHDKRMCKSCDQIFVRSMFLGNETVKDDCCMTCNLKLNVKSCEFDISVSPLSKQLGDTIKNLNESTNADLSFEILGRDINLNTLKQKETINLLKDSNYYFSILDIENLEERNTVINSLVYSNKTITSKYPCLFCFEDELNPRGIYDHFQHFASFIFYCETCKFSTVCMVTFLSHLIKNHRYDQDSILSLKPLLGQIIFIKLYEKINKVLVCLFCNIECNDLLSLFNHVTYTHLNCKHCGITCLTIHEYIEHNTQATDHFECKTTNCKIHTKAISKNTSCPMTHEIGDLSNPGSLCLYYFCPYCPENFAEEIHLLIHLKCHSFAQQCSTCERQFILKTENNISASNGKCFICEINFNDICMVSSPNSGLKDEEQNLETNEIATLVSTTKVKSKSCNQICISSQKTIDPDFTKISDINPMVSILFTHVNSSNHRYETVSKYPFNSITKSKNMLKRENHMYRCKFCKIHFESNLENLCYHFLEKHNMKICFEHCNSICFINDSLNHENKLKYAFNFKDEALFELNVTLALHQRTPILTDAQLVKYSRRCFICKIKFEDFISLRNHVENDHYYCKACGIKFSSEQELLCHQNLHVSKKVSTYKCTYCAKINFRSIPLVLLHFKMHHNPDNTNLKFKKVRSMLPNSCLIDPSKLQRSSLEIEVSSQINHCPYCYYNVFNTEIQLAYHILQTHKIVKCKTCSQDFILSVLIGDWMQDLFFQHCSHCINSY